MGSSEGRGLYKRFKLFYASQTGNAKAIAEDLAEQCMNKGLVCDLACISDLGKTYTLENVSCLVLIGATTGDGDPPDTARKFWRQLNKKDQFPSALGHLSYTVLGLGDTNYTNFCNFGKSVDQKLHSLGAKRFYPCGWGDDGIGLEIVVEPWIDGLFPALKQHLVKINNHMDPKVNELADLLSSDGLGEVCSDTNCVKSMISDAFDSKVNHCEISVVNKAADMAESGVKLSSALQSNLDVQVLADKYGLSVLSEEEIASLPIKSLAFPWDAKLTLPVQTAPYLTLNFLDDCSNEKNNFSMPLVSAASEVFKTNLVSLKALTRHDAVKKAIEVTLQLPEGNDSCHYEPGDSFGIIVKNPSQEVDLLFALLRISDFADNVYELTVAENTKKKTAAVPSFIHPRSSLRYVFEYCLDIRSVPKKTLMRTLIEHTNDPVEQRRLKELVSKEGAREYSKHVRESSLTVLDLFIIFQSCKPPITVLLEHLPQLQPRAYSVTSSPLINPDRISFVFNVVEMNREGTVTFPRHGICTGWLASFDSLLNKNDGNLVDGVSDLSLAEKDFPSVNIYFRNNQTFHLPKEHSFPIVMVGPGTGVAPFIGFLKHRQKIKGSNTDVTLGDSWLFFGCRHKERDYLYREELEMFRKEKVLEHLIVSFSRDEDSSESKYVQDNIRLHGADLASLIVDNGAFVYVCGDARNMAKDVFESFVSILELNKGLPQVEARKLIAQMQIEKRYLQDVWA